MYNTSRTWVVTIINCLGSSVLILFIFDIKYKAFFLLLMVAVEDIKLLKSNNVYNDISYIIYTILKASNCSSFTKEKYKLHQYY